MESRVTKPNCLKNSWMQDNCTCDNIWNQITFTVEIPSVIYKRHQHVDFIIKTAVGQLQNWYWVVSLVYNRLLDDHLFSKANRSILNQDEFLLQETSQELQILKDPKLPYFPT